MKIYGIVLVGCGHIGLEHLRDIYFRNNIRIIAAVDTDPEAARLAARLYGAEEFSCDYRKYLTDERVDIAIIATYTESHTELSGEFLKAGKNVLCEKPIANDAKGGQAFFKLASESSQKLLVAHILRHNRSYNKIKELIDSGEIGELKLMRMVQNHHAMNWERYKRLLSDCTPVLDCGVHYFDVARWFTGSDFKAISGFGTRLEPDSPELNHTFVSFTLENGCVGYYEAGWSRSLSSMNIKEFIGTKGRITLVMEYNRLSDREEGDLITVYHTEDGSYQTVNCQSKYKDMYAQLMTLIGMIEGTGESNPTLKDAELAHLAAAAAQYAVKSGETVCFENGFPVMKEDKF